VHLAVSPDRFRLVFFQGHPEYDTISLLKEYKREVGCYAAGLRDDYPPLIDNYFPPRVAAVLGEHAAAVVAARRRGDPAPELPEAIIVPELDNTWHDTAEAVLSNWIGKVYQVTSMDRRRPFMDGVNPEDPLNLRR
jgi:homoserine O-succinyltransferase